MSTNTLTPAQQARNLLAHAEEEARLRDWAEYRELEYRHRLARFGIPDTRKWEHGTVYSYSRKCRCAECKRAWADYMYERNKKIREANPKPPRIPKGRPGRTVKDHMHGTLTGYSYGCRCDKCKSAHAEARPKSNTKHGTERAYTKKKCRCRKCVKAQRIREKERWQRTKARRAND